MAGQGYSAQNGHLVFVTQPACGVAGTLANGLRVRHLSGGLTPNRDAIVPDPEIGGNRDIPDMTNGPISFSGDVEFYARMEIVALMLKAALGTDATVVTGTTQGVDQVGTHTITPTDATLGIPWLTIQEDIAGEFQTFEYLDGRVNTLSFECDPDGYFMCTAGLIARNQTSGATKLVAPDSDTTPLMVGSSMTITLDGVSTYITRSWNMEVTNNIEDDVFGHGSVFLQDMTEKRRELTMGMTIRPQAGDDLFQKAVYGAAAATQAQPGAAFKTSASVQIDTFEAVGTGVVDQFSFQVDLPSVVIEPFALEPSGDDVLEYDISLRAVRPDDAVPLATFTVVNDLATIV